MSLFLLQTVPDPVMLLQWAVRRRWLSCDGDLGYALHALMAEAFAGHAPTPYRYLDSRSLLAYSAYDEASLREWVDAAPSWLQKTLGLQHLRVRPFPTDWPQGQRLAFEVRVRPVVRTSRGKERDLFQYQMEQRDQMEQRAQQSGRVAPGVATTQQSGESRGGRQDQDEGEQGDSRGADPASIAPSVAATTDLWPTREGIYREWLQQQLARESAAQLLTAQLRSFSLRHVLRRTHTRKQHAPADDATPHQEQQKQHPAKVVRKSVAVAGPDAVFAGELAVGDPAAFRQLLIRGVGRHRAFGYGMLLLSPVGR